MTTELIPDASNAWSPVSGLRVFDSAAYLGNQMKFHESTQNSLSNKC